MRNSMLGVLCGALVACGVFGASEDPKPAEEITPEQEKQKADENAQTPVGGPPLDGVFVSSSRGDDTGSGAMENPVKTLARALAIGKERKARVIACAELFRESLTLVDGVSAFGSYDCNQSPWKQVPARARIVSPTSPAVTGRGLTLTTKLDGFEIIAPDLDGTPATDEAGTSIGLEVRDSKGLVVSQSLVHGGKGAPGTDGTPGAVNDRTKASNGTDAYDQTSRTCPDPVLMNCSGRTLPGPPGGTTTCLIGPNGGPGGQGGDSRWWANSAESTAPYEYRGRPFVATATTAVGGLNEGAGGTGKGLPGARGVNGPDGPNGSNGAWLLTATGFARGNGTAGGPGLPGGGGGGGGGARYKFTPEGAGISPTGDMYYATASGGGGAGGGCGGQAGTPGTGGGASIGALIIDTAMTFERTRLESSAGGRAGKGNLGTAGIVGGTGGAGTYHGAPTTGKGGDGGSGGDGGASGHGAPGPSIAIAYTEKPVMAEVDLAPGRAGDGQPELKQPTSPTTARTLPAITGESKAEHVITP